MTDPVFPADLFPKFGADGADETVGRAPTSATDLSPSVMHVAIGEDLIFIIQPGVACPKGNDAGEKFLDAAPFDGQLFDSDGNFLKTLGRFAEEWQAVQAMPTMVEVARDFYPSHVRSPQETP